MDELFKMKYPWEESLAFEESGNDGLVAKAFSTVDVGQQQQETGETHLDSLKSPANEMVGLTVQSQILTPRDCRSVTQDRLDRRENDVYNLLFGLDSKERLVFPHSLVYIDFSTNARQVPEDVTRTIYSLDRVGRK